MKIFKTLAVALLFTSAIVSCSKDSDATNSEIPKTTSIEGKYAGKYGFDNDTPDQEFILAVKTGGVFQEISTNNGNPSGQGTWKLNGNKLTATYNMLFAPYSEYNVSLTYDAAAKKLSGTWGFDGSFTDGGKMDVIKQ